MPSLSPKDRVSLCRFTFSDHRQCRTPRSADHPHFCFFHARQESRARTADNLANDLSYFFSGKYLSANDLCAALGRLIPAVARGDIKPRTASTLAYLAQTLVQAVQLAQKEYTYAFGTPAWAEQIRNNAAGNFDRINEDANNDVDNEAGNTNVEEGPDSDAACESPSSTSEVSVSEEETPENVSSTNPPSENRRPTQNCHSEQSDAHPTKDASPNSYREEPAFSSSPTRPQSTLPSCLPTVDSMPLTNPLNPLEATLTKN